MSDEIVTRRCKRCKEERPETLYSEEIDGLCVYCKADDVENVLAEEPVEVEESVEEKARAELALRFLTRKRLLPFVERFNPDYNAGWVHKDICRRLEQFSQDVVDKKSPRLMLFMPPRHGKSTLA